MDGWKIDFLLGQKAYFQGRTVNFQGVQFLCLSVKGVPSFIFEVAIMQPWKTTLEVVIFTPATWHRYETWILRCPKLIGKMMGKWCYLWDGTLDV